MRIKIEHSKTAIECFDDFLLNKKARGIADKTLKSYADHFHAAGIYIDWSKPIDRITMKDINLMTTALRDKKPFDTHNSNLCCDGQDFFLLGT